MSPISSRQKLQSLNDYTMNIHVDVVPINQSNQSKSLGLIIDENLSWKAHIHEISTYLTCTMIKTLHQSMDVQDQCFVTKDVSLLVPKKVPSFYLI